MTHDRRRSLTIYELVFRQYPGLLVRIRKPSYRGLGLLLRAERVLGVQLAGMYLPGVERISAFDDVTAAFADALVDWDLLADGVPVPATLEGLEGEDHEFVLDLVRTWHRRVVLRLGPSGRDEGAPAAEVPSEASAEAADAEVEWGKDEDEDLLANLAVADLPADAEELVDQPAAEAELAETELAEAVAGAP